ncbi:hypothetical protein RJ640_020073 [Escallonia rubra]|uniref:Tail specific protease domain-containing protein n=1 Tax=Escallonia rubra TaxID=112253 RepID=A0AA88RCL6_9ASTE|nr:hypothetical protein RJ640_020073 [Escallonia rubra]
MPVKRLSPAELSERRAKGLCFNCNDKFAPGHRCKKLLLLEEADRTRKMKKLSLVTVTLKMSKKWSGPIREGEQMGEKEAGIFEMVSRLKMGAAWSLYPEKGWVVIFHSRGITANTNLEYSSELMCKARLRFAKKIAFGLVVNKGTASASEILAGALKDNKRAVVLGEPTKIQSVFELSDGSGLAVTVAMYETPAHTDIDKVGVIPDYPLPASFPKDVEEFCGCQIVVHTKPQQRE